jgi:hypothetical protein
MSMNKSPKPREFFSTLRLQRLEKAMKNIQGLDQYGGMDYEDLCFLPNIKFPHKLKMPDFAKYDGTGDPTRFIVSECEADGMIDRRQACMRARFLGHDFLRKFDQMNL